MNDNFILQPVKPHLGQVKVLAVDDEKTILLFLETILHSAGYQVICCSDSLKCLDLAQQEHPDLILLDVMMPDMDGFEVCKQLKELPTISKIPVIFITIKGEAQDKIAGFKSGGVDYITKPFEAEVLLARLQKHMDMYWLRCALEQAIKVQTEKLNSIKQTLYEANNFLIEDQAPGVLSNLEEGSIRLNLAGVCLQINATALRLLGYRQDDNLLGKHLNFYPPDLEHGMVDMLGNRISIHEEIFLLDTVWHDRNGQDFPVEFRSKPLLDKRGEISILINFSDISQRKRIESRLHALAYKDAMTGLSNRTLFMMLLQRELAQLHASNQAFALLLLDVDYFKQVNDGYGHMIGDELLIMIAKRLLASGLPSDKIARLGGDEFSLIINGFKDKEELLALVAQLAKTLNETYYFQSGIHLNVTVSMGIGICDAPTLSVEDLLGRTDLALYKAKEDRVGHYYLYDKTLSQIQGLELELKQKFPALLENNSLFVEYQPQFSTLTQAYNGAEALIRWNHQGRGKLQAEVFFESAKKKGFIREISYFVLHKVCEQISQWLNQEVDFKAISVNICAEQIMQEDFAQKILAPIKKYQIPFDKIILEVTENSLVNTSPNNLQALEYLHQLGIRFAIDDFGVGFSSIKLLKSFHFDILKIDKLFIAEILHDAKNDQIVKSLISLAANLNLQVIAEGVETQEQLLFLREHHCDCVQGFYFSPSLSGVKLARYFTPNPQQQCHDHEY